MAAGPDLIQLQQRQPFQHHDGASDAGSAMRSLNVCIYLVDRTGIEFAVDNGQQATADDMLNFVLDELKIDRRNKELFSLWLKSPFLEVQMKPQHIPFRLVQIWYQFLLRNTHGLSQVELERDEPVIQLQRSAFVSKDREMMLRSLEEKERDSTVLEPLYHEARWNVRTGRYPCDTDTLYRLAGLQACIELGDFDPKIHTPSYFKEHLAEYLPESASSGGGLLASLSSHSSPHHRLCAAYREMFDKMTGRARGIFVTNYLQICQLLPFYGAAYFRGQIETPSKLNLPHPDTPVWVAVNREGVFVIDQEKQVLLLGLSLEEVAWEVCCSRSKELTASLPVLFLQFTSPDTGNPGVLQIFSMQAVMIDAMIKTCQQLNATPATAGVDMPDSAHPLEAIPRSISAPGIDPIEKHGARSKRLSDELRGSRDSRCSNKLDRLCLTQFDTAGEWMGTTGRKHRKSQKSVSR